MSTTAPSTLNTTNTPTSTYPPANTLWLEDTEASALLNTLISRLGGTDKYQQTLCDQFIDKWIRLQYATYRALFQLGTPDANLDNVQKRFDWLTAWLDKYKLEYAKVFPTQWRVDERFVSEWCSQTRDHFYILLIDMQKAHTLTAKDVRLALKTTRWFEAKLDAEFETSRVTTPPKEQYDPSLMSTSDVKMILPSSVFEVLAMIEPAMMAPYKPPTTYCAPKYKGCISACFGVYSQLLIDDETKCMNDAYDRSLANENWQVPSGGDGKVFSSIRSIFDYMSKCRERISTINMPEVVIGVLDAFKKCLSMYDDKLKLVLQSNVDLSPPNSKRTLCLIINTTAYILKMIRTVCVTFKSDLPMDERAEIDMQKEYDMYVKLADDVTRWLSAALYNSLYNVLCRTPQRDTYVADLKAIVQGDVLLLRDALLDTEFFDCHVIGKDSLVEMPNPENPLRKLFGDIVEGVTTRLSKIISSCNTSTPAALTLQYMKDLDAIEFMLHSLPSLYHETLLASAQFADYPQMIHQRIAVMKHSLSILAMPWEALVASVALLGFTLTPIVKE